MASGINRLIATQQAPNILGAVTGGMQARQNLAAGEQALEQSQQLQPGRNRLLGLQGDVQQAQLAQVQQKTESAEEIKAVNNALALTAGATDINDFNNRIIGSDILSEDHKQIALELGPQGLQQLKSQIGGTKTQFGGQQTFKDTEGNLFFGTTKRNTATGQVESVLAPISGGDTQPVGQVSLVSPLGQTVEEKIKTDVQVEADKEAAKLSAQFKLKPKVEAAVATAVGQAKAAIDAAGENRSNSIALNMYETATRGLVESLSETTTGPFVGFLPALTTNQQIAEGSVAAMAPILKQLFRGAGEGTFTDKDQELLLQMLPTRKDRADAIAAKLANIDAIVRAKLATPQVNATGQPSEAIIEPQAQATDLSQLSLEQLIQMRNQAQQ